VDEVNDSSTVPDVQTPAPCSTEVDVLGLFVFDILKPAAQLK